jgi:transcription antitermination factor NusG
MAKNRGQRRYYPSMAAHTPRPIVRPRIMIDRSLAWFAIHCRSRAEQQAESDLQRAGFSTYLPMQSLQVVKRGKLVEIERVPVSGYLFVGLCAREPDFGGVEAVLGHRTDRAEGFTVRWRDEVIDVPSMTYVPEPIGNLIRVDRQPIRVGAGALQAFADSVNSVSGVAASVRLGLRAGQSARIVSGALSGLSLQVTDWVCDDRVRGLVAMLGGKVVVEVDASQLEEAA